MVASKKTSGKFIFGYKNSPQIPQELQRYTYFSYLINYFLFLSEIEYYTICAKIGIPYYNGNKVDLGTACGKYFKVNCLSIIDDGFLSSLPCKHI
ncbi:hypothetical protein UlMin_015583 [Ulmus minor]